MMLMLMKKKKKKKKETLTKVTWRRMVLQRLQMCFPVDEYHSPHVWRIYVVNMKEVPVPQVMTSPKILPAIPDPIPQVMAAPQVLSAIPNLMSSQTLSPGCIRLIS